MENQLVVEEGKLFDMIGVQDLVIQEMNKQALTLKINGIEDKKGKKEVHELRMTYVKTRTGVVKHGEEMRAKAVKYQKDVIAEQKRVVGLLAIGEDHLTSEEKAVDDAMEAIKQEKIKQAEILIQARRNRLAAIGVGFNGQVWAFGALNMPEAMMKVASDEQFETFYGKFSETIEAEKRVAETERIKREDESKRLAVIAAEQEAERTRLAEETRKAGIQKALEENERKAKEDEIKVEQKRIADEKAEWERIKAEEQREIEREKQKIIDDARHAKELETARKESAEKAKKDAEEKIKRETDAAAEKERLAKLAAEKKAARAPDKVKILLIADTLDTIQTPDVKTEDGKTVALSIMMSLAELIKEIREKAGAL